VSAHEHKGVPLTVHKFAHGYEMGAKSYNKDKYQVNPTDIHKIGVMDYLTNNLDRHWGNLLVSPDTTNVQGYNPVLAIDHERNMQYSKILREGPRAKWMASADPEMSQVKETPMAYITKSALHHLHRGAQGFSSHHELVDWWSQHGQKIKDELESQVAHIKDPDVRNHVRDNFNNRWHKMNNWNTAMQADPEGDNMYDVSSLHHAFQDTRNSSPATPKITAKQLKSLPSNKKDALSAISDIVNKKGKLTFKQRSLLNSGVRNIISGMTPEEAGETFKSLAENPYLETKAIRNEPDVDPRNQMLRHFSDTWHPDGPKYAHMAAIADAIDQLPAAKRDILKSWADHFRRLISERQAA